MVLKNYEEIVSNFASPTLVLAGPGAGKTYLLADRIKRLLDKGTDKSTITVLTFGTDANQHMKDELIDPEGDFHIKFDELPPQISTMHSLGFKIVQEKPRDVKLRKNVQVQYDEDVKQLMYRDAALILGLTEDDGKEARECKQCGDCKEDPQEEKCKICRKYWEIMSKCNYIDFDDQILFACQILEKNPDILEKYQSGARHLLVDEYQDINAAQFRLIQLLSKESPNGLFVVGDDAQSIYGFRGGNPKFILRFGKDFRGAETPSLAHSWRCQKKIMDEAIKVLEKYYTEWTGKKELEFHVPIGEETCIWQLPSNVSEADMVARVARYFINKKKTVLILAPKKEFFPLIIEKLCEYDVPHECPVSFLPERVHIAKRFIDWVANPNDSFITRLVVEYLINIGIAHVPGVDKDGRSTQKTIEKRIAEEAVIAKLWESVDKNNDLFWVIENVKTTNETLVKIRGGLKSLMNSFSNFTGDNQGEFAKQLSVVTGIWCAPSKLVEDISTIVKLLDSERPSGAGSVLLKTMWKAKGLEADVVFMVGLEDDLIPNPRSSDIVEEARLFYVSMTRAKEKLYLFHAFKRPRGISYGQELMDKRRSKFLDAIGRASEYKKPKEKKHSDF
jgi:DNA helicase-2/ATP-dependent DNA helicase PcrA